MKTEYENFVAEQWGSRRGHEPNPMRDLFIMTVGLAGETGEVCELLKNKVRDGSGSLDEAKLALELGDVRFYSTRIAINHSLTAEVIEKINVAKLLRRREHGKDEAAELALAREIIDGDRARRASRALRAGVDYVLIEREAVANFMRSTDVPRFQRMCAAALGEPAPRPLDAGDDGCGPDPLGTLGGYLVDDACPNPFTCLHGKCIAKCQRGEVTA